MSDQIRKLSNNFKVAGKLAEISQFTTGETKKGVPYVGVECSIQYGDTAAATRTVKYFSQEYSLDEKGNKGKESKIYPKILEFFNNNKEKTIAKVGYDNAAEILAEGSFSINDYVNASNEVKSAIQLSASFVNPVDATTEPKYYAQGTIEGYIQAIKPEMTKGDDAHETGRLRITIITTSFRGEAIPVTAIVEKENADYIDSNYEVGQTAKFYTDWIVNKVAAQPKTGGFGVHREEAKSYAELIIVGADAPFDSDDEKHGISKEAVKVLLQTRNEHLKEVETAGYLGNKSNSSATTASAKAKASAKVDPVADDEIPF